MIQFKGIVTDTTIDREQENIIVIRVELKDDNETRCIHLGECTITQESYVANNKLNL